MEVQMEGTKMFETHFPENYRKVFVVNGTSQSLDSQPIKFDIKSANSSKFTKFAPAIVEMMLNLSKKFHSLI